MLCRPSRRPTSRMTTCAGNALAMSSFVDGPARIAASGPPHVGTLDVPDKSLAINLGTFTVPVGNGTIRGDEPPTSIPVSLRLFVAVCEERNIARAAEREAIVASAISKRIAAMEDDVGVALLSAAAAASSPRLPARRCCGRRATCSVRMERMRAELSEFASGAHGSVRVFASLSVLSESPARRHRAVSSRATSRCA